MEANESEKTPKPIGGQRGNSNNFKHGYYSLKARLDGDGLDRRSSLSRALVAKVKELSVALGGDPSPQEMAIINDSVKVMLYLANLDHYLSGLKSLVRKGRVHAVLSERTRLAAHLRENLKTLGLKRTTKQVTLEDVLENDHNETQDT